MNCILLLHIQICTYGVYVYLVRSMLPWAWGDCQYFGMCIFCGFSGGASSLTIQGYFLFFWPEFQVCKQQECWVASWPLLNPNDRGLLDISTTTLPVPHSMPQDFLPVVSFLLVVIALRGAWCGEGAQSSSMIEVFCSTAMICFHSLLPALMDNRKIT